MTGVIMKNPKKIRIGIIGGNFGTLVHLPAFRLDPRAEVIAIAASTPERSQDLALEHSIKKGYSHWQALLEDPYIDAISIAVPPSMQAEIILAAFEHKKAIFAEKPLTINLHEAKKIYEAAVQANLPHMINFHLPTLDPWQQAKKIIQENQLGEIRHIIVQWCSETKANLLKLDHWKVIKGPGQGALFDFLCTIFYCIEWFAEPIQSLNAKLFSTVSNRSSGSNESDSTRKDTFDVVTAKLASGTPVSITLSTAAFLGNGHRIEFSGEEGCLVLENTTRDVTGFRLHHGTRATNALGLVHPSSASLESPQSKAGDGRIISTGRLIKGFLDWIEKGIVQTPNFKDGLRIQALLDAAWTSDLKGHWVNVEDE